ncbi:helix-turn-helix transcriptional regulator [Robertmurraya sp. DFI.2.37]|uniref:helix-turn-helix domain-containing protein n=1 Tax=Robertmurraya sp. DFI.2.37 TaxID=3031819 RepID=UPI001244911A|nr:helix-turn-helix transcriptional regulator [Robertmurraya sp. DFI.2.37]MDF1511161.1 helix-turn-helix transcriptional regulator [Robertmurraya sp. DFI.2.37]
MFTNADAGRILQRVRKDAGYTQADVAELFNYDTSVISKLENAKMSVMFNLYMDWLKEFGRDDILALTIMGVPADTVLKVCFTEEYKEKLEHIKSQPPSPEAIERLNKLRKKYGFVD